MLLKINKTNPPALVHVRLPPIFGFVITTLCGAKPPSTLQLSVKEDPSVTSTPLMQTIKLVDDINSKNM